VLINVFTFTAVVYNCYVFSRFLTEVIKDWFHIKIKKAIPKDSLQEKTKENQIID